MLKDWIELEINRCGDEKRLVDLNAMWHIVNDSKGYWKGNFRDSEWTALLDGIDKIIDNRIKDLKALIKSKR